MITIIGLGCGPEDLTAGGKEAILSADKVILRTGETPPAESVRALGVPFETLDYIYGKSRSFDTLGKNLAAAVSEAGKSANVAYCVDGDASEDVSAQILLKKHKDARAVGGVSKSSRAFAAAHVFGGTAVSAYGMQGYVRASLPLCVYDIDCDLIAGDVKLKLCDLFGDEADAFFVSEKGAKKIKLYEADRQKVYGAFSAVVIDEMPLLKKKRFDYEDLLELMRLLRAPGGCPWDRAQTHESIRANMIEEAYELVDAIDRKDPERMREEAGDVLMQAVFHTLMEEEAGNFNMTDVISEVTEKLITRHTHVFGQDKAAGADGALSVWEKNKMTEKHQKTFSDSVNDVPEGFPALLRAEKVVKRTGKGGWKDTYEAAEEALFAAEKRLAAAEGGNTDEALGELLLAAVRLGKLKGGDAEQALLDKVKAVQREYTAFEVLVLADGKDVNALTPEERKEYERRAHESL